MKNKLPLLTPLALLTLLGMGCNKSVTEPDPFVPAPSDTARNVFAYKSARKVDTVKNLRADTSDASIKPYTYFDLDGKVTLAATGDTSSWDLALRTTGIRINGQFQVLTGTDFDSLLKAPDSGYAATGTPAWYDYNSTTFTITPKSGTVLAIKTAGGKYVKLQILSYYKNSPANPAGLTDTSRYFTFRYFLQPDGSKNLNPAILPYTYYSLRTHGEVTDTAAGWDLALRTTSIKVNGLSQLVGAIDFDTLSTAPETGYGSGSTPLTWYDYSGEPNHTITPKLATVLLVKTSDNKYAKVQILSYYKGAPANPNGVAMDSLSRNYTFRYFLQADGTRTLK